MNGDPTDFHRLRVHRTARRIAGHEEITDLDRMFARVDFDFHSSGSRDEDFAFALFTECDAGLGRDDTGDARVVADA